MDDQAASFMLGEVSRLTVAAIFALAAIHAMRDWTVFAGIVERYRIAPRWLSVIAARTVPPLELAAAAALLVPSRAGAALGLCLMASFTAAIVLNIARGRVSIDCGCGGVSGQTLSKGLVLRNAGIMAGLVVAWGTPTRATIGGISAIGVLCASAALIALYFAANQLMRNFQQFGVPSSRSLS
jgi:hypothetical protein